MTTVQLLVSLARVYRFSLRGRGVATSEHELRVEVHEAELSRVEVMQHLLSRKSKVRVYLYLI